MANISITSECNRSCRYCFARSTSIPERAKASYMPFRTFRYALDFLERSGIDRVRILGGEPSLHPEFPTFVKEVMERNLSLLIFSNGMMPTAACACLENISRTRLAILINIGRSDDVSQKGRMRQLETLRRFGRRITLGLNIDTPAVQFDFLLELIETYDLARTVRLGLAHPVSGGENHSLLPRDYSTVGRKILEFIVRARSKKVNVEFDCGFVPCMFLPEGLETLGDAVKQLGTRCNPILDILPDGRVISCYPLTGLHQEELPATEDAFQLRKRFQERFEAYRSLGIFKACSVCEFRTHGLCVGGCLSTAIHRLRHESFHFTAPQLDSSGAQSSSGASPTELPLREARIEQSQSTKWVIPYIDQPLSFWEELADSYRQHIKEVYFPLPGRLLGSGRPPQAEEYLDLFLRNSPFALSVLINPILLSRPVDELAPHIIEILRKLTGECHVTGITVADLLLATRLHKSFPDIPLTASVLLDIFQPNQVLLLRDIFQHLVPASRIMRNLPALKMLKDSFPGKLRLMVNEACLPNCPFRVQHFYEMGNHIEYPHSLCDDALREFPWMRLTGAWVLPQHLHLYDGVYDELKISGRVTLSDPKEYRKVLDAYIHRTPLMPNEIGGGPAAVLEPLHIREEFFKRSLYCDKQCHSCSECRSYL